MGISLLVFFNHILLPITFLLVGVLIIKILKFIFNKLPESNWIKQKLNIDNKWNNPIWMRDKIDMIFTIAIFILIISLTFIYS